MPVSLSDPQRAAVVAAGYTGSPAIARVARRLDVPDWDRFRREPAERLSFIEELATGAAGVGLTSSQYDALARALAAVAVAADGHSADPCNNQRASKFAVWCKLALAAAVEAAMGADAAATFAARVTTAVHEEGRVRRRKTKELSNPLAAAVALGYNGSPAIVRNARYLNVPDLHRVSSAEPIERLSFLKEVAAGVAGVGLTTAEYEPHVRGLAAAAVAADGYSANPCSNESASKVAAWCQPALARAVAAAMGADDAATFAALLTTAVREEGRVRAAKIFKGPKGKEAAQKRLADEEADPVKKAKRCENVSKTMKRKRVEFVDTLVNKVRRPST